MRYTDQSINDLTWPGDRLTEAIDTIARPIGNRERQKNSRPNYAHFWDRKDWASGIALYAANLGIEAEPISCVYSEVSSFFQKAAPAIALLPQDNEDTEARFLVLKKNGKECALLAADQTLIKISSAKLADLFRGPISEKYSRPADQLISQVNIQPHRAQAVNKALVDSWLGSEVIQVGWMFRPAPGASLWIQIRQSRLIGQMLGWVAAFGLQNLLFMLGWWLIGRVVMNGQTDRGWVAAWALVLISAIPFQLLGGWLQNRYSESMSVIFKQRLLYGALKTNPDDIKHLGTGQFLERVTEAESFEMLAVSSGLNALMAVMQLASAAWVLSRGSNGFITMSVLGVWFLAILVAGFLNYVSGKKWTDTYRDITNGLVEKMVGHRTRLAQEDPTHRHDEEDEELEEYEHLSRQVSISRNFLSAIPSSWLIAGLASFVPALISQQPTQAKELAVSLGGVMLAQQAFEMIQNGIHSNILLLLGWKQVGPIYNKATEPEVVPSVMINPHDNKDAQPDPDGEGSRSAMPLITARDLSYRFSSRLRPVLNGCDLEIFEGDHILMEGASGGGKTTIGAILAGLRKPESGLLFLHGYDRQSIGEGAWRQHVAMAPQFHENHIFNETFAFNLLMGRNWPPTNADMQLAAEICEELGLADLLARMPSGWQQMLGESGWQLSHGERSRVFIARALLQNAELVIMDESFGALDPENLFLALDCARRRAATLMVIAHP